MCTSSFYVISAFLVLSLAFVSGQSPYPGVFEYKRDNDVVITVRSIGPVSTLKNTAKIKPLAESLNIQDNYNSGIPLLYRVDFSVQSPLPRVTSITVHDNVLCCGPPDMLGPNQFVDTSTSMAHTFFFSGGSFKYNPKPPPKRPQPKPENEFDYFNNRYSSDGDTQITFEDDGKKPGTWNMSTASILETLEKYVSNLKLYFHSNSSPEFERPVTRPPPAVPPRQPEPQYYPEVVTQPPRPIIDGDTQITFEDDGKKPGTWNMSTASILETLEKYVSNLKLHFHSNSSPEFERPVTRPPPAVPPPRQPEPQYYPEVVTQPPRPIIDGDTQITFEDDGKKPGTWNMSTASILETLEKYVSNLKLHFHSNSSPEFERPVTRPPPAVPPPRQPEPQYYPEVVTQPPRPIIQPSRPQQPVPSSNECGIVAGGTSILIFNNENYDRGEWPWLVAIYERIRSRSLRFICSGTLVSDKHVVTAAHCIESKNRFTLMQDIHVKIGAYSLEDWDDDITVTRALAHVAIHKQYNASTLSNDIMVLTLKRSVEFNANIQPACLWSGDNDLSRIVGAPGVVAGWGQSERKEPGSGQPRAVKIPVVSTSECRASNAKFHNLTSSTTLCAGDRNSAGPCVGTAGSGLYILERGRWCLRGVVSLSLRSENGDSPCNLKEYIVFTDSAKYLRWIQNVMNRT